MNENEIEECLKRVRKSISESEALVEQAERRIAETDELLARVGVTREELRRMRPTPEQMQLVNEELARRGLEPLEPVEEIVPAEELVSGEEGLEHRKRQFGAMMNGVRL